MRTLLLSRFLFTAVLLLTVPASAAPVEQTPAAKEAPPAEAVSYTRQVLPIFRQHCQGCHQPAKRGGDYLMTDFASLVAGGETGEAAIVPGKPDESYLIQQVTPVDGQAAMPQGDLPPLSEVELLVLRQWIAQGAVDDSPQRAAPAVDADHPPAYHRAPAITSLDVSPDGSLLAVSGFHEVFLVDAASGQRQARLVGLSDRINSVRFSPDGKRLAVAGGTPSRAGEIQVWDVQQRQLQLSLPVTYDTLSGLSWSPDGTRIAFGCADNTVRAIDAATGQQVLFQGAHSDWVHDTVFTADGSHLVSVGRDMTCKLTEVATERFIDNVTSITPGALSGGIHCVERHPERDEILVGGADGVPKIYRVFRQTARKIGDDANLLRRLPEMNGRIFSVAISPDGSRLAAAATVDGTAEVRVWAYDLTGDVPAEIQAIEAKRINDRKPEEIEKLEAYRAAKLEEVAKIDVPDASVYAIRFAPDNRLAIGSSDGIVRMLGPDDGRIAVQWTPAPITDADQQRAAPFDARRWSQAVATSAEAANTTTADPVPPTDQVVELIVEPSEIHLQGPYAYTQLLVMARLQSGDLVDVTRVAELRLPEFVTLEPGGLIRPATEGSGQLQVVLGDHVRPISVRAAGLDADGAAVDFVRDVAPVLSRLGCNQGTCHGSAKGKNGFRLSLRGYDPIFDVRALSDDLAGRRLNVASPDDSLMLLKPLGVAPHEGGTLIDVAGPYHAILRRWIADGATLDRTTPKVQRIELLPQNPVIQELGARQQVRVVAWYADGSQRDVTRQAFVETGNAEVATVDATGVLTAVRRGEAPILARYEGAYAATTLTAMGDRQGFEDQWQKPETWGRIDQLVADKWLRMKLLPSDLCRDEEFVRRVHLDLTGLPPTADVVRAFLADMRPTREKRSELIDQLIGNPDFVQYWTNKWADLLQVNSKFLGDEGAKLFHQWIQQAVAENRPYDQFARQILTASGSNKDQPAASYFKVLRTPEETMENTTHLFLGIRFNCNKCHDHPFERWTQDQYYETAAFFSQVSLKPDPASGNRKIGGTAVEGAKPLFEQVVDVSEGEMIHQRTGLPVEPEFPFACEHPEPEDASRRQRLAAWMTAPDNPYFARSYVNRLWGYLTGVGLIEPLDDIRAGNPPTNPQLLDHLTTEFIDSGFDVRHIMRLICNSRTYQLSFETNRWNEGDHHNYSHATPRRLPAEVLYDAVHFVTGAKSNIPGVPAGTRAAALPDADGGLADGFLTNLGRPVRESACECERSTGLQLGPVMALVSGPTVGRAIAHESNDLEALVRRLKDDSALVEELFLRILSRLPTDAEKQAFVQVMQQIDDDHRQLQQRVADRQSWWDEQRAKLEKERLSELAAAEAQLVELQKTIEPEVKQKEKERAERIAAAEAALQQAQQTLSERLTAWHREQADATAEWFLLEPAELKASNGATLRRTADRAIMAEGNKDKGIYTVTVRTRLSGITGLRLEALPVEQLDGGGPGFPANGNFVVTELEVTAAPLQDSKAAKPVQLTGAEANFSQSGFGPDQAIDGNNKDQKGWAVSPAGGTVHWATFQTSQPIVHEGGTLLTIRLHQQHNAADHRLARFRISATTDAGPVKLGLPEPLLALASVPADQRSEADQAILNGYAEKTDAQLRERREALAAARQPLPEDPRVTELKQRVTGLQKPTADDPQLVQLRSDLQQSETQMKNIRLTAAEDLTWALINSPAFLFNR